MLFPIQQYHGNAIRIDFLCSLDFCEDAAGSKGADASDIDFLQQAVCAMNFFDEPGILV